MLFAKSTFEAYAILMAVVSPSMKVQAGFPMKDFDARNKEANDVRDRSLAADPADRADPRQAPTGETKGLGILNTSGTTTLIISYSSLSDALNAIQMFDTQNAVQSETETATMSLIHLATIEVAPEDVERTIAELEATPGIIHVCVNEAVNVFQDIDSPSGGLRTKDRRLQSAETTPWGITKVKAAEMIEYADRIPVQRKICIVDTGYGNGHPDLPSMTTHNVTGFSPYGDDELWNTDGHGHGSHCAGTIGAIGNNEEGVIGVNPDPSKFSFHIGKGLKNSGSGSTVGVMQSVASCVEKNANIISMSLGGGGYQAASADAYKAAYEENGVLIIAAAGNSANSNFGYPASYPHVMSVAAVDIGGNKASFSQFNTQVEIAGPGVAVNSTITTNNGVGFSYDAWAGTSMACPHVAGVAALVWSYFPECSNTQIRMALIKSAEDKGEEMCDDEYGHGIVDALEAYKHLEAVGCADYDPEDYPPVGGCLQWPENVAPTPAPTPFDCSSEDKVFQLDLLTDNYGGETTWTVTDLTTDTVLKSGGSYGSNEEYVEKYCVGDDVTGCLKFNIMDAYGDGICCSVGQGSYSISYSGQVIERIGDFGTGEELEICPSDTQPEPTPAPTSALTTDDDGDGYADCDGIEFRLEMTTDAHGDEITWEVKDVREKGNSAVASGGPYNSNEVVNIQECIATICGLTFTVKDSYGDGISTDGSYQVFINNEVVFSSSAAFKYAQSTVLIECGDTEAPTPAPSQAGCLASCYTSNTPWVSSAENESLCQDDSCKDCTECNGCTNSCSEYQDNEAMCSWHYCSGCEMCDQS